MKFEASTTGPITGIRFYKGPQNTGTHVGDLWTASGTLLASATFTNETASGWQEVDFAKPVAITAGTTYVESYHTDGNYSANDNYFASSPQVSTSVLQDNQGKADKAPRSRTGEADTFGPKEICPLPSERSDTEVEVGTRRARTAVGWHWIGTRNPPSGHSIVAGLLRCSC